MYWEQTILFQFNESTTGRQQTAI